MSNLDTRALLVSVRLTWIIFIGIALLHLYVQHYFLRTFISDLMENTAVSHAALITAEEKAAKAEILADIAILRAKVQTIHDIVVSPTKSITTAPTQAGAVATPTKAGRKSGGGRRGKR